MLKKESQCLDSDNQHRADDYTNAPRYSDDRIIIVARVALGKSNVLYRTTEYLTEAPIGYDSVSDLYLFGSPNRQAD